MKLIIDNRETAFYEICKSYISQYPHIEIETAPLDLGDFELYYKDELLLVWERKTFRDLISSIKDGRYREQGHRLYHTYKSSQVVYLIEGIISQLNPEDKKMVTSAMTSMSFEKGFHIWRSIHTEDSVKTVLSICDKLKRDFDGGKKMHYESQPPEEPKPYSDIVKKVKKDNITPLNIGDMFLCQIPGINNTSASAIMKHVSGDFSQLYTIVRNNPEQLSQIKVGETKPRKISSKIVENLITFLGTNDTLQKA